MPTRQTAALGAKKPILSDDKRRRGNANGSPIPVKHPEQTPLARAKVSSEQPQANSRATSRSDRPPPSGGQGQASRIRKAPLSNSAHLGGGNREVRRLSVLLKGRRGTRGRRSGWQVEVNLSPMTVSKREVDSLTTLLGEQVGNIFGPARR